MVMIPPGVAHVGCAVTLATGVAGEMTVMVMPLDVAGEPVGQAALEVITTVTTLPFTSALLE